MTEPTDLYLRRKLYKLISKNPGLHAIKIAKILKISTQLADYHLLYLIREEIITSVKEAGYRRYYIKGKISIKDKKRLSILRQEIPLKIILLLLEHRKLTHKQLLSFISIAPSTLSYHIKKLMLFEMLDYILKSGEKKYQLIDAEDLKRLLIKYKPYSWISNFEETWEDLSWK